MGWVVWCLLFNWALWCWNFPRFDPAADDLHMKRKYLSLDWARNLSLNWHWKRFSVGWRRLQSKTFWLSRMQSIPANDWKCANQLFNLPRIECNSGKHVCRPSKTANLRLMSKSNRNYCQRSHQSLILLLHSVTELFSDGNSSVKFLFCHPHFTRHRFGSETTSRRKQFE